MYPGPKVWLGEDGILRVEYPQDFDLTLEAMLFVYRQCLGLTRKKRPVLVYAETVASAEYEAQQFVCNERAGVLVGGMAIIVKSVFTRALGDLFMRFHQPPYPARIFSDEGDAIEWLATMLPTTAGLKGRTGNC